MVNIVEAGQLLEQFEAIPKVDLSPTYLGICKYPYSRFEEICSRLLCFYFTPANVHGLGDIFLQSLLDVLKVNDKSLLDYKYLKVISEENAEGKRIDILIHSDKFVLGIENKITADLYNPLYVYKNQIELYSKEKIFKVVLSLRKITNRTERQLMDDHGFVNITYRQLFDSVLEKTTAINNKQQNKYLLFLNDFIKTIHNMTGLNVLSKELSDYFYDNTEKINELVSTYEIFKKEILRQQNLRILDIREKIQVKTSTDWWLWEDYILYATKQNANGARIGLEGYYESIKGDAVGLFDLHIVTWSIKDWNVFEKDLLQRFPFKSIEKSSGKCSVLIEEIRNDDEHFILEALAKYYELLELLTNNQQDQLN